MSPADLIEEYRSKAVLLDTNLLVLLVIGLYRRHRVSTFKRTAQYTLDDFVLINNLIKQFANRITTPHILAEVDNLARQLPSGEHRALAAIITPLIANLFEIHVPSEKAANHARYPELGLTDCATIAAAKDRLVITDDFRLSQILSHLGRAVINFNHIRSF